jgi:alginate O-acetyltransferase complex protein AlgI
MVGTIPANEAAALLDADVFSVKNIVAIVLCALFVWQPVQAHQWTNKRTVFKYAVLFFLFILATAAMFTQSFNPFLYFQF